MKKFNKRSNKRSRTRIKFNPTRGYLEKSILNFLNAGGKVNKIEMDERSYGKFISLNDSQDSADGYLSGV